MNPNALGLDATSLSIASGVLTALFLTNIGAILGVYVSMRIQIAVLKTKADVQARDINNLGKLVRTAIATKTKERK